MRKRALVALLLALTLAWPVTAAAAPGTPTGSHIARAVDSLDVPTGAAATSPLDRTAKPRPEVSAQEVELTDVEYTTYEWYDADSDATWLFIDVLVTNLSPTVTYNDIYAEVDIIADDNGATLESAGAYSAAWALFPGESVTMQIWTMAPDEAYSVDTPTAWGEPELYDTDPVALDYVDSDYYEVPDADGLVLWEMIWENNSGAWVEMPGIYGPAYNASAEMLFCADAFYDDARVPPGGQIRTYFYTYRGMTDYNYDTIACQAMPIEPGMLLETEIAGSNRNRIGTAIEAAREAFPDGANTVIITTAYNWPDALSGSGLAGFYGAPILLTAPTSLSSGITGILDELGAVEAIILGSEDAVSARVEDQLASYFGDEDYVIRLGGKNRYETSRIISNFLILSYDFNEITYDGTGFVATGLNFPDALAASPIAARWAYPVYLVDPRGLDSATGNAMSTNGLHDAYILGSTKAVPAGVMTQVDARATGDVRRLWGNDRYSTAAAIAQFGVDEMGMMWDRVALATGTNFPDALAGGVLQGMDSSVMLLTAPTSLSTAPADKLRDNRDAIMEIRYLGSDAAISWDVRDEAAAILRP